MSDDKNVQPAQPAEESAAEEMPFDPLLAQAERLPASIRGSEGDKAHVLPVDGEEGAIERIPDEAEEDFGEQRVDQKDFTVDS